MDLTNFNDLFFISFLPPLLCLLLERFVVLYCVKDKRCSAYIHSHKFLQPNAICYMRMPMGILAVLFYVFVSKHIGYYIFSFWIITDITDGTIARRLNLDSDRGKVLDPLSDKFLYFPPLFYLVYLGVFSFNYALLFFILDVVGQFSRRFTPQDTGANIFGKSKTLMCVLTLFIGYMHDIHSLNISLLLLDMLLLGVCFLAFLSFFFRIIPNYWYANILSLLNLTCGIFGIYLVLFNYPITWAFILVFFGQFLDLFDGRAAEKWGSTPRGELIDDLADGTNFGGTIALIVFASFENFYLAFSLALLHFCTTVYRLLRFLSDKKKANVVTGVSVFNGLPSPGAALLTGSALIFINNLGESYALEWGMYLKIIIVIIVSILMVSHIPYLHVGRAIFPKIPKTIQVILYTLTLLILLISLQTTNYSLFIAAILPFATAYVIFGIQWKKQ